MTLLIFFFAFGPYLRPRLEDDVRLEDEDDERDVPRCDVRLLLLCERLPVLRWLLLRLRPLWDVLDLRRDELDFRAVAIEKSSLLTKSDARACSTGCAKVFCEATLRIGLFRCAVRLRRSVAGFNHPLDAIEGPVDLLARDHQRRRYADDVLMGLLAQYAQRHQRLAIRTRRDIQFNADP